MRTTDRRFTVAAKLHKAGCLNDLDDLFDFIPPTVVARHLGFKYDRIKELQQKPLLWRLADLSALGRLLDMDRAAIVTLVLNQIDKMIHQGSRRVPSRNF